MEYLPVVSSWAGSADTKQCVNVDIRRVTAEVTRGREELLSSSQAEGPLYLPFLGIWLYKAQCDLDSLETLHNTLTAAPLRRAAQVGKPDLPPELCWPASCPRLPSLPQSAQSPRGRSLSLAAVWGLLCARGGIEVLTRSSPASDAQDSPVWLPCCQGLWPPPGLHLPEGLRCARQTRIAPDVHSWLFVTELRISGQKHL